MRMTLRQFLLRAESYWAQWENEWERTRQVITVLVNANSKKKIQPKDVIELKRDRIEAWKRQKWHSSEEAQRQRELIRKNWLKDGK